MRYTSTLLVVRDMAASIRFYKEVLELEVVQDFGANVTLAGGIALQILENWREFIGGKLVNFRGHAGELYFEEAGAVDKEGLLDLIARINTRDEHFTDSRESTSWKALREAEELTAPGLFPLLQEIINTNEGKTKEKRELRNAAYFIYGRLMEKVFSPKEVPFFLGRLKVERDKCVLSSLLDRVSD